MNGIVVIDKPLGRTSHDVVLDVKKILGIEKAGHTGTLDPLATGVLPVCINEATKLAQFYSLSSKDYCATMLLGVTTDTLDVEGRIVANHKLNVKADSIGHILNNLVGKVKQIPPQYSAVKFHGKPLYKWARQGIRIEVHPRTVEIYSMKIEDVSLPYVTFTVSCSKGTYIRSLCSDIGELLGCGASLARLRRTRNGCFMESSAISLESIDNEEKKQILTKHIMPMADTLPDFISIIIDQALMQKIRVGFQPTADTLKIYQIPFLDAGGMVKFIFGNNCLVAIGRFLYASSDVGLLNGEQQAVKILRVFNE